MQNREFEKTVQQKMDELQFVPSDAVWDKVEAGLPEERKRRWIIFILLFAALTGGLLIWWNNSNTSNKKQPLAGTAVSSNSLPDSSTQNAGSTKPGSNTNISAAKNETTFNANTVTPGNNHTGKQVQSKSSSKIKIKNAEAAFNNDGIPTRGSTVKNNKPLRTKGASKVKVKSPVQVFEQEVNNNEPQNEITASGKINGAVDKDTTGSKKEDAVVEKQKTETDSATINKKDTVLVVKQKTQQTMSKRKWQYGIELAAGVSNVKNDLFSSSSVYSSPFYSTNGGTTVTPGNAIPNKPIPGAAFGLGFYVQRSIDERWKFKTGVNYLFQSGIIKVGNKVDSAANFSFDINKSIAASSYYRSGNTVSYKNKSHLLEIPLLFQFRLSKTSPFYAEAGPGIIYLLQSNALVYNSSSQAFVSEKNIYNKLSLSVNAGLGTTLAQKTKFPFTVGFMFKYGAGSLVKKSFGKQHLVNTLFYLRLPLKK